MDLELQYDSEEQELDDTLDSSYFSHSYDDEEVDELQDDFKDSYFRKISDL